MLLELSDNALLLATCIGLYISYRTVFDQLYAVKEETRTPKPSPSTPKPRELDPNAEDQIDPGILYTLSKSPNYELRSAAIKILIDRASRPEMRTLLLRNLRSLDPERRQRAMESLVHLLHGVDIGDWERHQKRRDELSQSKETIQSLVTALINVQLESKKQRRRKKVSIQNRATWMAQLPPSPIRPLRRSPQESKLIRLLTYILDSYKNNPIDPIGTALQAGLVNQWLANYPFPCALPEYSTGNFKKSDVVSLFEGNAYETDDSLMSGLMSVLTKNPRAMKELRNAGLTTSTFKEDIRPNAGRRNFDTVGDMMVDVPMNLDEDPIGLERFRAVDRAANGPRVRSVERNQEEARLRRRHREAIVVADHDEPLSRQNILQRQDSDIVISPLELFGENEGGDDQSQSSHESMPDLEDISAAAEPVNRSPVESPHSFRQRVIEGQPPRAAERAAASSQDEHHDPVLLFTWTAESHDHNDHDNRPRLD